MQTNIRKWKGKASSEILATLVSPGGLFLGPVQDLGVNVVSAGGEGLTGAKRRRKTELLKSRNRPVALEESEAALTTHSVTT